MGYGKPWIHQRRSGSWKGFNVRGRGLPLAVQVVLSTGSSAQIRGVLLSIQLHLAVPTLPRDASPSTAGGIMKAPVASVCSMLSSSMLYR